MANKSFRRVFKRQERSNMPKAHISLCFVIFLCLSSQNFMRVNSQSQGSWCIANALTDNEILLKNINFACSQIDCGIILEGGSCYDPNTPLNHASVAMNLYYQAQGRHYWNCQFDGSGLITVIDPSEFCLSTQLCNSSLSILNQYLILFSLIFRPWELQISV
ncbi:unnamed protein product [Brassica oleracea var. botrytis]|uniref:(rape) hypothetical protein n=1 Tax=Brassica napus TaxID=3708 RepID=A0A816K836_BRANA|nr:unnamed protein product [Brassica napus]